MTGTVAEVPLPVAVNPPLPVMLHDTPFVAVKLIAAVEVGGSVSAEQLGGVETLNADTVGFGVAGGGAAVGVGVGVFVGVGVGVGVADAVGVGVALAVAVGVVEGVVLASPVGVEDVVAAG